MVDMSIVSPLINAAYASYDVDASHWPNLAGLIARVREIPAVNAVLEKEAQALGL
jgi:glutathione S-transferase